MNTPVNQILMQKGRDVVTVSPQASIYEAVQLMDQKNIGALLVLNAHGKIAGILAERDCFRKVVLLDKSPRDVLVKNVMTKKVVYATPENTVDECMALMTEKHFRHLPVLNDDGSVAGIVSIGDLVKATISAQQFTIAQLEHYIAS